VNIVSGGRRQSPDQFVRSASWDRFRHRSLPTAAGTTASGTASAKTSEPSPAAEPAATPAPSAITSPTAQHLGK
jgi:hypothetical protein